MSKVREGESLAGKDIAEVVDDGISSSTASEIRTHLDATTNIHGVVTPCGLTESQTLTNKTLTTPTIGDFSNATHDHSDASNGGTLPYQRSIYWCGRNGVSGGTTLTGSLATLTFNVQSLSSGDFSLASNVLTCNAGSSHGYAACLTVQFKKTTSRAWSTLYAELQIDRGLGYQVITPLWVEGFVNNVDDITTPSREHQVQIGNGDKLRIQGYIKSGSDVDVPGNGISLSLKAID